VSWEPDSLDEPFLSHHKLHHLFLFLKSCDLSVVRQCHLRYLFVLRHWGAFWSFSKSLSHARWANATLPDTKTYLYLRSSLLVRCMSHAPVSATCIVNDCVFALRHQLCFWYWGCASRIRLINASSVYRLSEALDNDKMYLRDTPPWSWQAFWDVSRALSCRLSRTALCLMIGIVSLCKHRELPFV